MMTQQDLCDEVNMVVERERVKQALAELTRIGVKDLVWETGRAVQLAPPQRRLWGPVHPLVEEPSAWLSFWVPRGQGALAVAHLARELTLPTSSMGSAWSRPVELWVRPEGIRLPGSLSWLAGDQPLATGLKGLCCIVQKGEGNTLATVGLTTGAGLPTVSFGVGTGLRNRLGLWRVLIPAEKEIVFLVVHAEDADSLTDLMVDAGGLDKPGKGFLYEFPVECGVLSARLSVGETAQVASLEQIIAAIDHLQRGTQWRRKALVPTSEGLKERRYLTNLVDLSVECNEGASGVLTQCAMASGAAGATTRHRKHLALDGAKSTVAPAREVSVMTVGASQVGQLVQALTACPEARSAALSISACPAPRAITYLS